MDRRTVKQVQYKSEDLRVGIPLRMLFKKADLKKFPKKIETNKMSLVFLNDCEWDWKKGIES